MIPRLTARARAVMQLANREAQRLNHEYIGTEHLLLGLLREGGGVGCDVLRGLNVDLDRARREVLVIVQQGPDMIVLGEMPQTPWAKKAIEYAIEEAVGLGHEEVGTGELLLGLVREQEGVAGKVLLNLGVPSLEGVNDLRSRVAAEHDRMEDDDLGRPRVDLTGSPVSGLVGRVVVCLLAVGAGLAAVPFMPGYMAGVLLVIAGIMVVTVLLFWVVSANMARPRPVTPVDRLLARNDLRRLLEQQIAAKFGPLDETRRQQVQQWDEGRIAEANRRLTDAKDLDDLMG